MDRYKPYLDWIDIQHLRMCQMVTAWANVNSGTLNIVDVEQMAGFVRDELATLGGDVETLSVDPWTAIDSTGRATQHPLGPVLRLVKRPLAPLRVFLGIHLDTVYAKDHPFQTVATIDENTLRGPGVADAKGGLVVMLTALQAFERSPFATRVGWEVLVNADEEIGSPGSAPLLARAAQENHLGLVFEPALPGGAFADRRRGVGEFAVVLRGRSAHAGRDFERGRSAIVALGELILEAHALNGVLPGVTVNVGRVEGGGATNMVPDLAICRINVRTTEHDDQSRIHEQLDRLVAAANARDGITAELFGAFTSPPKVPSHASRSLMNAIELCGHDLGIPIEWRTSGGACDGNKLAAAGLPNIDTLGPRGGAIHSPDEYILLDSLTERAKLTALLLMMLATGEIAWPPT